MQTIDIVARTQNGLTQGYMTEVMHSYRRASLQQLGTDGNGEDGVTEPGTGLNQMEEQYCALMAAREGGLLNVAPARLHRLAAFLGASKGTLVELNCVVVLVSPDDESQRNAVTLLEAIVPPGSLDPGRCRLMLVDCPHGAQPESVYAQLYAFLRDSQLDGLVNLTVLSDSRAFENVRVHKLPLGPLLQGTVDLEEEFAALRAQGASEKRLRNMGRRLMAARTVMVARHDFERALNELDLLRPWKDARSGETGASSLREIPPNA
jgi:hypothetical protein